MKVKNFAALFGLFIGALVLFSFTLTTSYSFSQCHAKVTDTSTSGSLGVSIDGDWEIIGHHQTTIDDCGCPDGVNYIEIVNAFGAVDPSLDYIIYDGPAIQGGTTIVSSGSLSGDGDYDYY